MNHEGNIRNVLKQADKIEWAEGLHAYYFYNLTLQAIAKKFDLPLMYVAGAFSALSPNSDYNGNLRSVYTICLGLTNGNAEEDCTVSTYNHNRAKAWRILNGEHFYSVFKGLKVRNFFRNLTEPNHPEAITIDEHMYNVYRNQVEVMSDSGFSKGKYETIANTFRKVAYKKDVLPCQLQAILWLVWKRTNNIKSKHVIKQELLFEDNNRCGVYVPIEAIKPYPIKSKVDSEQNLYYVNTEIQETMI